MNKVSRRRLLAWVIAAQILVAAGAVIAAAPPAVSPEDAQQIMQVSQIKRGMRGYGLTVFQGTRIEKFDVEILGVLPKMNTGRDLILVRIGGGPITGRQANIVAGMSGSPCYINGKIIGALSAGFAFSKEPVGLVTPIQDMLEAWDANLPAAPSGYSSPQSLPNPLMVDGKEVRSIAIDKPGEINPAYENGVLRMRPLMTPLMVTGFSMRGMGRLAEVLRPFGIEPMAGPGTASISGVKAGLEPGAAIGISLARGDIDMTAVGTVTYRRGNRVLAMGHPFLGVGAIDAPMTTAFVTDVVSQYLMSTKLGAPIEAVGRVFQDRPWSVAGAVGSASKTIPAVIRVNNEAYKRNRMFRVQVMNHPLIAAGILTAVVGEAVYQAHPSLGDVTAAVSYEVIADQVGKITRSNAFFDPVSIDEASVADLATVLSLLSRNRFYPLDIKSVNVTVNIQAKRETANVDRVFVKKSEFEPGETVEVGVVLRPFKQDRITKMLSVKIPATASDGRVTLQVRGGATPSTGGVVAVSAGADGAPAISGSVSEMATADNVRQLVDKYLESEKNTDLVLRLIMPGTTVNVAGERLTGLPEAIAGVMKSSRNSGLRLERDEVKEIFDAGVIAFGSQQITINVKRKDLKDRKTPSRTVAAPVASTAEDRSELKTETSIGESDGAMTHLMGLLPLAELPDKPESDDEESLEESSAVVEEVGVEEDVTDEPSEEPDRAQPTPKPAEAKRDIKTVVRQPKVWTQSLQSDFANGEFSGVSASSKNRLELVPTVRKIAETPEQFVWDLTPARDGVYAGTGNSGRIYHISDAGAISVLYETGELQVNSLASDSSGTLYAGTSPNGRVFRISPDGNGKEVLKARERYVLALTVDSQDNVYVGVGDAGKVYKIAPDGSSRVFAEINEHQVLSLAMGPDGSVLIGTGPNGVVYKADTAGRAVPVFDADEDAISSIISDSEGNIYAGTSSKGMVYKITREGRSKAVLTKADRVLSLARDTHDNIYAVSDGSVVKITPEELVVPLDSSREKAQFLALAYNDKTQTLYAGTGNIGVLYAGKCSDISGTFESAVHDTGMMSRWGKLKWVAEAPEGTSVEIRTRTGSVPTPDSTWSPWSWFYSTSAGSQITAQDSRYIQYQVTLKTTKPGVSARVSSVSVYYLTPNQQPKVEITAPKGGSVWAGRKTITWTGSDPDKDTLTYDVYYSSDGGNEWKPLVGGIRNGVLAGQGKSVEEITAKIKAELQKSAEVPEDMKQEVLREPPRPVRPAAQQDAKPPGSKEPATKTSHEFDTLSVPDGTYVIKVVASDRSANAEGALTGETIGDPFTICNKPPRLSVPKSGIETGASGVATVKGWAASSLADIVGVQYRVDTGAWTAARADDGVFDSPTEDFTVETESLSSGRHRIEIQAIDAAGNASSGNYEVKVKQTPGDTGSSRE